MTGYKRFIARLDKFIDAKFAKTSPLSKAWHHPAGPKTVFFWAPAWKWSLVIAGISDLARPAHKLSLNNSVSLVANGAVYTRWYYWAIQPRNAVGASCSLFLACTGAVQAYRRWHYDTYVAGSANDPALTPE